MLVGAGTIGGYGAVPPPGEANTGTIKPIANTKVISTASNFLFIF